MTDAHLIPEDEAVLFAADEHYSIGQLVRAEARRTRNLIRRIMSDTQAHLDADITALSGTIDALEAEIATLKTRTTLDFTNADNLVAKAKDAVAALTAPAAPADATAAAPTASDAAAADQEALAAPSTVPPGQNGTAYAATLAATGGTAPYTFTVEGLPDGLTAAGGAISGTPAAAGSFELTVTVTDSVGATAQSWPTLTVS